MALDKEHMKAADFRGMLGYIAQFRDKIFVLNADSAVLASENLHNLLLDVAVLQSLNIRTALVHGCSAQLRALAQQTGTPASDYDGMGVTDAATLRLAILAANQLAHEILEGLNEADQRAAVSNAIIAHPAGILEGTDHQWTGTVEKVDAAFLQQFLTAGVVPVIPPIGFDGNGQTFRVNSDGVALEVSEALRAHKLIHIADPEIFPADIRLDSRYSVEEADEFVRRNKAQLHPALLSKLRHGIRACRSGVQRVHLIDGTRDDALLGEIFSNEGVGTMIYANEYESIRPARRSDVSIIRKLIRESVDQQQLLPRTRQELAARANDFFLFELDRKVVGCIGLRSHPGGVAELECLFVDEEHENKGIGRKLITFIDDEAKRRGMKRLIALSTQAYNYFVQKGGYREGDPDDLPPARRAEYDESGRKSKVLVKNLG